MSPTPHELIAELEGNGELRCIGCPWPAQFRFSKPYTLES